LNQAHPINSEVNLSSHVLFDIDADLFGIFATAVKMVWIKLDPTDSPMTAHLKGKDAN
jgi:hypothetical protein